MTRVAEALAAAELNKRARGLITAARDCLTLAELTGIVSC